MFDKILFISDKGCNVKLKDKDNLAINLMNLHLIFEDDKKKILGEVDDLDGDIVRARFLGEIINNKVVPGTLRKPSLDAKVRVISQEEIPLVTGVDTDGFMKLGTSPFYDGKTVFLDVNNFFSNHFAIFGNTGSGKSCGVTRLFQNMFHDQRLNPYKANILIFDSSLFEKAFCLLRIKAFRFAENLYRHFPPPESRLMYSVFSIISSFAG